MTGQSRERDDAWDLGKMVAAYHLLMDAIVPESQYWQGRREDPERVAAYSDAIVRASERRRAREATP